MRSTGFLSVPFLSESLLLPGAVVLPLADDCLLFRALELYIVINDHGRISTLCIAVVNTND